ncbi:MAG: hypothetical protein JSV09_15580, partial [Thermoplasmata archaeon]
MKVKILGTLLCVMMIAVIFNTVAQNAGQLGSDTTTHSSQPTQNTVPMTIHLEGEYYVYMADAVTYASGSCELVDESTSSSYDLGSFSNGQFVRTITVNEDHNYHVTVVDSNNDVGHSVTFAHETDVYLPSFRTHQTTKRELSLFGQHVNTAIDQGLEFLRRNQEIYTLGGVEYGYWHYHSPDPPITTYGPYGIYHVASTAFAVLAFIDQTPDPDEEEVVGYIGLIPEDRECVDKAIRHVLRFQRDTTDEWDGVISEVYNSVRISHGNYETSSAIIALSEYMLTKNPSDPDYTNEIQEAVNFVVRWQYDNNRPIYAHTPSSAGYGGFGYAQAGPGLENQPDMSNTPFAVGALGAAQNIPGIDIEQEDTDGHSKAWSYVNSTKSSGTWNDGGHRYHLRTWGRYFDYRSYGTATAAAIWCYNIFGAPINDPEVNSALEWFGYNLPGHGYYGYEEQPKRWPTNYDPTNHPEHLAYWNYYFYLWTASKAFVLYDIENEIGGMIDPTTTIYGAQQPRWYFDFAYKLLSPYTLDPPEYYPNNLQWVNTGRMITNVYSDGVQYAYWEPAHRLTMMNSLMAILVLERSTGGVRQKEQPVADAGPDQEVNEGDPVPFFGCNSIGSLNDTSPSIEPGVVALWHMDEDSGSIIYDETPNNNDGTISGANWAIGKFGSALEFGDTDLVYEIPASFDDSITDEITIVSWIYWEGPHPWTYSQNSYIFDARDFFGARGGFIFYLDLSGTLIFLLLYGNNVYDYQFVNTTCRIPIGRWTHVAGVLDFTNLELKLFINGREDANVIPTEPYNDFESSHNDAAIGNNRYAPTDSQWAPFNGVIDEVVIYNRSLTAQELPRVPSRITSYYWDFDVSDGIDWDNPDAEGPTPTHIYGDDGIYTVTLKITDETNASDTDTCFVTVHNVAPTLDPNGPYSGFEGSPLTITSFVTDPGSDDLTFTWNWGDGTPITSYVHYNDDVGPELVYDPSTNEVKSPWGEYPFIITDTLNHIYGDNGIYLILLIVNDDDGGEAYVNFTVTINNVAPTISMVIALSGPEGSELIFLANASDPGSDDLTFTWEFEYGPIIVNQYLNNLSSPEPPYNPSTNEIKSPWGIYPFNVSDTVTHTYGDNYDYTLTLNVSDDDGGWAEYITSVSVYNLAPSIIEIIIPSDIDEGSSASFLARAKDNGSDDLNFTWEFELGPTISNIYPNDGFDPDPYPSPWGTFPFNVTDTVEHTYGDNGNFQLLLTIADDDGGITSYITTITVNNVAPTIAPFGPFTVDEGSTFDLAVSSTDTGSDDLTFTWEFELGSTIENLHYNNGISPEPVYDPITNEIKSPWGSFPFNTTDIINYVYGDDGMYIVLLTVTDDDGGSTTYNTTITVNNVAPTIAPFGPFTVDEGSSFDITATSTDPGSDDLTYKWEFEHGPTIENPHYNNFVSPEPIYDQLVNEIRSPWGNYPFTVTDTVTHTYGDNYNYTLILTVNDDDGGSTIYTTTVIVENVAPTIESVEGYMFLNLTLRVAGEKWHSVGIHLVENGTEITSAIVTRYPGNPDEQTGTIVGARIDMTKNYTVLIDYLPNDPRVNGNVWGANPVWIEIGFEDGSTTRLHHTFNVRKSYWNSDHWNHIDPWEVELNPLLVGHNITFEARATDLGSDDLIFAWDFGDGN